MEKVDVVIIGGGPAGIAAAIQLKRSGIGAMLFEKNEIGGLLRNANRVENYPGFPEGISGKDLIDRFKSHLDQNDIEVNYEEICELTHKNKVFFTTTRRRVVESCYVIVASGTKPKKISTLIADGIINRVCYEIYNIQEVQGKRIVIIGAGDAAFDYALNLSQANTITILNRKERPKCLPLLWERYRVSDSIEHLSNSRVEEIKNCGDRPLIIYKQNSKIGEINADYVLIAIGRDPDLSFVSGSLNKKFDTLRRENKLHLVGDVKNGLCRQVAISVGDGIKAAMEISLKGEIADGCCR